MTKRGENQLSCSVVSQTVCRYFVRWLLNGQHYPGNEAKWDRTNSFNCIRTVTFSPPTRDREPNGEDLFTCEVMHDSDGDVKLFNISRQLEGETLINTVNLSHSVMTLKFCHFYSFFPFCSGSDAPNKTPKPTTSTVTDHWPNTGGTPVRPVLGGNPAIGSGLCLFLWASSQNSELQAAPVSPSSSYRPVQQNRPQSKTWAPSEMKAWTLRLVSRPLAGCGKHGTCCTGGLTGTENTAAMLSGVQQGSCSHSEKRSSCYF